MIKSRMLLVGLLSAIAAMSAAAAAGASTLTVTAQSFSGVSLGLVDIVVGGLTIKSAVNLSGSINAGTYVGTLGTTVHTNIGTIRPGTATSSTPGFTTTLPAGSWDLDGIGVAGNGLLIDIRANNVALLVTNGTGIRVLIRGSILGRYDQNTGLLTFTSNIVGNGGIGSATQIALNCTGIPAGTPSLTGSFAMTPDITWTLA